MKYKSEAQAYQEIRRYYKYKMRDAQRQQVFYTWSVDNNGERHPFIKNYMKSMGFNCMPMLDLKDAQYQAYKYQRIASECHQFLNRFIVKNENT